MNNNLFIKYAKPLTEEEKARLVVFYEDAKTLVRLKVKKAECPLELLFIAEDVAIAKYNRIGSEGISQESVDVVSTTYYNIQGIEVMNPEQNGVYVVRNAHRSGRVTTGKVFFNK